MTRTLRPQELQRQGAERTPSRSSASITAAARFTHGSLTDNEKVEDNRIHSSHRSGGINLGMCRLVFRVIFLLSQCPSEPERAEHPVDRPIHKPKNASRAYAFYKVKGEARNRSDHNPLHFIERDLVARPADCGRPAGHLRPDFLSPSGDRESFPPLKRGCDFSSMAYT